MNKKGMSNKNSLKSNEYIILFLGIMLDPLTLAKICICNTL